ncbi:MAG: VC_2705 family sodium/solute symporter [Armatimonadota bacterium]|nr:VC_2705 family sodium/solute symporter [Armatimonadota bacterium]MDR7413563.1 VC_2705 family sodium/solute symporter [Armatimonadota bacterium]MDR7462682.1 VC_2705 family sodium/solute symporter [Armatimonadota bacterium]MDR7530890.1 VC_2705 family sodium/solute symporter [Armatimonadota bacterium]MDR7590140.1 VC_2705 family sodium/solute symporter [Armatimonadota bacterium]
MRIHPEVYRVLLPSVAGYVLLILIAAALFGPRVASGWMVIGSILMYIAIAYVARGTTAHAMYVAERRIPPVVNGAATAADWMSAASFLSMAGAIALLGYDGLPYIIGWTLGYTIHAFFIAPYVRKSHTWTVPDLVETRAGGYGPARVIAVIMLFITSLTYLTAQLVGAGVVFSRFLGIPAQIGVFGALFGMGIYAASGGWKSITWTQFAQYIVLIVAYLGAALLVASIVGIWKPLPWFGYGELIQALQAREVQAGLPAWTTPFAKPLGGAAGQLNWILSAVLLMLGTIGLPHILMRSYTVPSASAARLSVGWALFFIGLLYCTAPMYAAMARYAFSGLWGKPIAEVQSVPWVAKFLPTGLIKINDANGDGILQAAELSFHGDIVVIGMPDMWNLAWWIAPFVAVGGLAAALSTADGLLMVMVTGITRDIYHRFINPSVPEHVEVRMTRVLVMVLSVAASFLAFLAIQDPRFALYVALLVGWAFVFAAASFTPAVVLGTFWKRLNRYGIVWGMVAGMATALPYVLAVGVFQAPPLSLFGQPIGTIGWGCVAFVVNLVVSVVVSLLTQPEGEAVMRFVDRMRLPELARVPAVAGASQEADGHER